LIHREDSLGLTKAVTIACIAAAASTAAVHVDAAGKTKLGVRTLAAAVKAKAKPSIGVKGTTQMAGGEGVFGTTYTVIDGGGYGPVNFTLKSAEYSVERINLGPGISRTPKVGEKLLVIHYRLKNPKKTDLYFSSRNLFQIVDSNGNTIEDLGYSRRESEQDVVKFTMKPGQGIDDLVTCAIVPAQGSMDKLILQLGRAGTSDKVIRYPLGANKVGSIPAPYADASGTGALPVVPAQIGTPYAAGFFDIAVDSVAFAPGPIGDRKAGDGNRFLVATVSVTNKTWHQIYFKDTLTPVLLTDDDEKTTTYKMFKGKRDEAWEGRQIDPAETVTLRYGFVVPNAVNGKTLTIAENVDNSGGVSKALSFDISSVK